MGSAHRSRGQTEALGYVLIFSVVILSIGSVYVSGIASMDSQQAAFELDNAEQAMLIFSDNVEDITRQESPRRSVEIKTTESSIETTARYNVTVRIDGGTVRDENWTRSFAYRGDAGDVVFESGAVIRHQNGGAVMKETPPFRFSEDGVVLDLVRLGGQEEYRDSGTSLAVLTHDETRSSTDYSTHDSERNVSIALETAPSRADAWRDYFEEQGLEQVGDEKTGKVRYSHSVTGEVLVRESFVWVDIEE